MWIAITHLHASTLLQRLSRLCNNPHVRSQDKARWLQLRKEW